MRNIRPHPFNTILPSLVCRPMPSSSSSSNRILLRRLQPQSHFSTLSTPSSTSSSYSSSSASPFDLAIIGGGIIGLACARSVLLHHPKRRIILLERESQLVQHQSSHNSGVIHAGIYYQPGSQRAELCRSGSETMFEYCREHSIPAPRVGKLIVARDETELEGLKNLMKRGLKNGCKDLTFLETSEEISKLEPNVRGHSAILSPHTGIVDFKRVAQQMEKDILRMGGTIRTGFGLEQVRQYGNGDGESGNGGPYHLHTSSSTDEPILASHILTCAGIHSDRVAHMFGGLQEPQVIPVRGSWFRLKSEYSKIVKRNIYPVPNPAFPFLGVHFTPTLIDNNDDGTSSSGIGGMIVGPNAVLATSREGYNLTDFNLHDTLEMIQSQSLKDLIWKHWKYGMNQFLEEVFPRLAFEVCREYVPSLEWSHLEMYQPLPMLLPTWKRPSLKTGVRAQALTCDGRLEEDFVIQIQKGLLKKKKKDVDPNISNTTNDAADDEGTILHIRNAPSPAATSSLAIAERVVQRATKAFRW